MNYELESIIITPNNEDGEDYGWMVRAEYDHDIKYTYHNDVKSLVKQVTLLIEDDKEDTR
jgi:hypothetical protein|tara:strand:+ start:1271 stop:1450 length:180 start_codon:yes stop_codon:yes gene_type:complete